MAEIQALTEDRTWRYVDSTKNRADDLTRGKTLQELKAPNRWSQGPSFRLQSPDSWPEKPNAEPSEDHAELRKTTFCGATVASLTDHGPDNKRYSSWQELLEDTVQELQGATRLSTPPTAEDYQQVETKILLRSQKQSFPEDYKFLAGGKLVSPST